MNKILKSWPYWILCAHGKDPKLGPDCNLENMTNKVSHSRIVSNVFSNALVPFIPLCRFRPFLTPLPTDLANPPRDMLKPSQAHPGG